jgi:hypothetical protein
MLAGGLPLLLFSAAVPQAPVGAGVCLCLYSLFLLQKLWLRRGFVHCWAREWYGPLFVICALLLCVAASLKTGLLFCAGLVGSVCALFLLAVFMSWQRNLFAPVNIRPASFVPVITKKTIALSAIPFVAALTLGIFFIFQSFFFTSNSKKGLYFPIPVRYTERKGFTVQGFSELEEIRPKSGGELPDLGQFITWAWRVLTFPYVSLNNAHAGPVPGAVASMPVYTQTDAGIVQSERVLYIFDDTFIAEVLGALDTGGNAPIERVLKNQGRFAAFSYGEIAKKTPGHYWFTIWLFIAAALAFPVMAVGFFMGKRYG